MLWERKKERASCQMGGLRSGTVQPEQREKWGHVEGLFISCSQVVHGLSIKGLVVEKGRLLNRLPTSYEPFFSPIEVPYSINISTETEEED